jgi:hypothetical protein
MADVLADSSAEIKKALASSDVSEILAVNESAQQKISEVALSEEELARQLEVLLGILDSLKAWEESDAGNMQP